MASSSKESFSTYAGSGLSMELELDLVTIMYTCLDVSFEGTKRIHAINWRNFMQFFETEHIVSARNLYIDVIKKKFPEANGIIGITGLAEDVARQCAINMGFGFTSLKKSGVTQEPTSDIRTADHNGLEIKLPDELRGRKVVIIDALLSYGRIKDAVKLCNDVGVEVVGAVVLIKTQQGVWEKIDDTPFVSILDLDSLNGSFWKSYFDSLANK